MTLPAVVMAADVVWVRVRSLEAPSRMTRTLIEESVLVSFDGRRAVLSVAARMRVTAGMKLGELRDLFRRACGQVVEVVIEGGEGAAAADGASPGSPEGAGGGAAASGEPAGTYDAGSPGPEGPQSFAEHPLIKEAIELFSTRPGQGHKG